MVVGTHSRPATNEIRISTRERAWYLFLYYYYMPVHYDRVFFGIFLLLYFFFFCISPNNIFVPHLTFVCQTSVRDQDLQNFLDVLFVICRIDSMRFRCARFVKAILLHASRLIRYININIS